MNAAAQTIFTVFFAIAWGITSNVMAKWKPFHYALCCCWPKPFRCQALCRTVLSFTIFNVLPLVLFCWVLWFLHTDGDGKPSPGDWSYLKVVARGGLPGLLIPFGCYHLWLAVVHALPTCFYAPDEKHVPPEFRKRNCRQERANEPDLEILGIPKEFSMRGFLGNLIPSLAYIVIGIGFAWGFSPNIAVTHADEIRSAVRAIMGEELQRIGENLQRDAPQIAAEPVKKPESVPATSPVEPAEQKAIAPARPPEENTAK